MNAPRALVALAIAALCVACGGDDVAVGAPSADSATGAETPACDQQNLDRFIDQVRDQGIDADSSTSESPAALAASSDLVVAGQATGVRDGTESGVNSGFPSFRILVSVDEVLAGDPAAIGETAEVVVPFNPSYWTIAEIDSTFEPAARGLFFLENVGAEAAPEWHPAVDGAWLTCGDEPRSLLADPEWTVASMDALATGLTDLAAEGDAQVDEAEPAHDDLRYEVTGPVLERPGEPAILCLGPVRASRPPAGCGEPTVVIEGMDWDAIGVEPITDVYHADATLVGTFEGDRFVLTEPPVPPRHRPPVVNALDLSSECEPPLGGWTVQDETLTTSEAIAEVTAYAEGQPDFAGMWVDWSNGTPGVNDPRDAVLNLRFTGSLHHHEVAARERWGGALCIVEGSHTHQELETIERTLHDEIEIAISRIHPKLDVVLVHVVVPTAGYTQQDLDKRFGEHAVIITSAFDPIES